MIAEIGRFLIGLALLASFVQMVLAWRGADQGGQGGIAKAGAQAAEIATLAAAAAMVLLIFSFIRSDFSIAYVAANSHVDKPFAYKIAASWGGHEGSMLLWCLLLALFGYGSPKSAPASRPCALAR